MDVETNELEVYEPPLLAEVGEFSELTRGPGGPNPEDGGTFMHVFG